MNECATVAQEIAELRNVLHWGLFMIVALLVLREIRQTLR